MDSPHCSSETLSALLDRELPPTERARARGHVDSCPACAARLATAARLDAELGDARTIACAALLPTLSATADGEATPGERALAGAHLAGCAECRATSAALSRVDALLASLPAARPSVETDRAIAALGAPRGRRMGLAPVTLAWRTALAVLVAIVVASGATWLPSAGPGADRAAVDVALVAAVQRVVFDARTNTLYVLDGDRAEVAAIDATTQQEHVRIAVGGKPTAMALNIPTNTLLVLDASDKRLTEIDTVRNTVISASALDITGTPTSLQVDPNGKIVVSSVAAAPAGAAATQAASSASTGHVTVFDALTKQIESVRTVDVAPQLVVLDPKGVHALLVSAGATTLADAATYTTVERLPGGIAAAFDVTGQGVAILSADPGGSRVSFRGGAARAGVTLAGAPLALIAMPDGGFAALLNAGGHGQVAVIGADGAITARIDVALAGRDLTYDAGSGRFAVGGAPGGSVAFTGAPAVAAASPTAPPSDAQTASPSASPSAPAATPRSTPPSTNASPSASPAPSTGLPPLARLAWTGTYRLALPNGHQPVLVAGSGANLWFVDQAKRLATIDTATGLVTDVVQLPFDGTYSRLLVGSTHVFAVDQVNGRISIFTTASLRLETIGFPFVSVASGFALGQDDKFWSAGGEATNALAFAPDTKQITAVDLKTSRVTALTVDSAGRVWFADDASGGIGSYDPFRKVVTRIPVKRQGSVTALAVDKTGALWAGTTTGELIGVWLGVAGVQGTAGGAVGGLVADPGGTLWSYASTPGSLTYRAVPAGSVRLAATGATSLSFDSLGRAWLGDPTAGAFYIVVETGQ